MSRTETGSCDKGTKKTRQELIDTGIVVDYIFECSVQFKSPTKAAQVVYGGSQNGKIMWKNAEGKTLNDLLTK